VHSTRLEEGTKDSRQAGRLWRAACLLALVCSASAAARPPGERRNWYDTPFDQAVAGAPACPRPEGPMLTEAEMRLQAHGRIERGTSCWLAKKCDDSNVYRRDPEIQQRVLQAIRSENGLARSSVWITTERRYVTLQGCVEAAHVRERLLRRVRALEGVEQVFDQLIVGTRARPRWTVDPEWRSGR
jgi:hypothetical protein